MLNAMYVEFDQLSEKHNVYKVRKGSCSLNKCCLIYVD